MYFQGFREGFFFPSLSLSFPSSVVDRGGERPGDAGRQPGSGPGSSGCALDPSPGPVINTRFVEEAWQALLSTGLDS